MDSTRKKSNIRWLIMILLFTATTLLYIDRSALGIMAPFIQDEIGWTEQQYGYINATFMIGYGLCFLIMGTIVDKIGVRWGYVISMGLWSVAQLAHAVAKTWGAFAVARFGLSIGQSGSFPVAIKTVGEWFPEKERALAIGIFNGGTNVGTIIAPLMIPVLVEAFQGDWRIAFIWTFPISVTWILFWFFKYKKPEKHPGVTKSELDYIRSNITEKDNQRLGWGQLLRYKETWAIAIGKFLADPVWWFYLFWGAKFLNGKYGLNLKEIGIPFFTIYLLSWFGGIFFGWLSSKFLKQGWSLNKGRKMGLLASGLAAIPVIMVPHINNLWISILLIALAAGGHCGWSANIFSLMTDIFPKKATASITGLGGGAGAIGGALAAFGVGKVLQHIGIDGYVVPFAVASFVYLLALLLIHILVPRFRPVRL